MGYRGDEGAAMWPMSKRPRRTHWQAQEAAWLKQLPQHVQVALSQIEPSITMGLRHWPCDIELVGGRIEERVILTTPGAVGIDSRGSEVLRLAADEIVMVRNHRDRLPPKLANRLYARGESGMGYFIFAVKLRDGRELPFFTGDIVDFPNWPPGVHASDVVKLCKDEPRALRDREVTEHEETRPHRWCVIDG